MDLGLKGKTALVCASTSGLGYATAAALADEGVTVAVTGRNSDRALETANTLPGAVGIAGDIVTTNGVEALIAAVRATIGEPNILVLNGPGPAPGNAQETNNAGIEEAFNTLVSPHVALIRAFLPSMLEQSWGRIVSISSTSIETAIPNLALSNLGRSALAGYLKTLANEVAAKGVTVNSLLPGRIATPRAQAIDEANATKQGLTVAEVAELSAKSIPVGRYGDPREFGAAAAFLSSEQAAYITGTALRCDGGMVPTL